MCSDFGLNDHFPGVMKGVIFSINPDINLVDLTHNLRPFNTARAAFVIKNSYGFFPEHSVHLAVVDPGVGTDRKPLAVSAGGSFFVGPDNGIFTHVFKDFPRFVAYEIKNPKYTLKPVGSTFDGRDIFAPAAAHISLGLNPRMLGPVLENPFLINIQKPVYLSGKSAEGIVAYVDSFGNLISNIESDGMENPAQIEISGFTIDGISGGYSEHKPGKAVAVRGSSGFIEIAVNRGSAFERFGGEGTKITVRKGKPSAGE